jgi:hypothetical protein
LASKIVCEFESGRCLAALRHAYDRSVSAIRHRAK